MLERYVEAGFDPQAFWGLTLRLYQIHMRGAAARMRHAYDEAVTVAWMTERFARFEKLPPVDRFLHGAKVVKDAAFKLRAISARLPAITMAEYQSRGVIKHGDLRDR